MPPVTSHMRLHECKQELLVLQAKLESAEGMAMSYQGEIDELKGALGRKEQSVEYWQERHRHKCAEYNDLHRNYSNLKDLHESSPVVHSEETLANLWKRWFPKRKVPDSLSIEHLYDCVMADYERRLRNVDDNVARATRAQRDSDTMIMCDLCSLKNSVSYIGHPYPSPEKTKRGRWVHNIRTRDGHAVVVECRASRIHEHYKEKEVD